MTTENIDIVIDDGGSVLRVTTSFERLAKAAGDADPKVKKAGDEVKKGGTKAKDAAADTNLLSKALGNAGRDAGILGRAIGQTSSGMGTLQGALSGVAAYLSVTKLIEYADGFSAISNKMRLVSTDQASLNKNIESAFAIAQKTGTEFDAVAGTYGKVSQALKTMGRNTSEAAGVTQTIAQSVQLAGTSAESAKNGLRQFEQGLASGVLRGDEFNSVVENTPGLALALAAGMKSSGAITVGELRKMAEAGELTGKRVVEALQRVAPSIDTLATTAIPTVGQAFQRLQNALVMYVGKSNEAGGYTAKLAQGITWLSQNLDKVVPVFTTFVALLLAGAFASAIQSIASLTLGISALAIGIAKLTLVMLANPLFLAGFVVTIAAAAAAMKAYGVSISDVTNLFTTNTAKTTENTTKTNEAAAAARAAAAAKEQWAGSAVKAAAGLDTVGASATASTGPLRQVETISGGVARGFTTIEQGAKPAGDAMYGVRDAAGRLPPALRDVEKSSSASGKGFEEIKKKSEPAVKGFEEIKKKAEALPPALLDVETTGSIVSKEFENIEDKSKDASKGIAKVEDAAKKANPMLDALKGGAAAVQKALGDIAPPANAAAQAIEKTKQAAAATGVEFNQLGEKLQTLDDLQSKWKAKQDAFNAYLDEWKSKIDGLTDSYSSLSGSYSSFQTTANSGTGFPDPVKDNTPQRPLQNEGKSINEQLDGYSRPGGDFQIGGAYATVTYDNQVVGQYLNNAANVPFADLNAKKAAEMQKYVDTLPEGLKPKDIYNDLMNRFRAGPLFEKGMQFNTGGSFTVGGVGGADRNLVSFRATKGEEVSIAKPTDVRRGNPNGDAAEVRRVTIVQNNTYKSDDYETFGRNGRQIAQDQARRLRKAL